MQSNPWQIVLQVGAELGAITLYGRPLATGWAFHRSVRDQTPLLIDENESQHPSEPVADWSEALKLLDRYPWARLHPIKIHATFCGQILAEVRTRLEASEAPKSQLKRWEDACEASLGVAPDHRLASLITEAVREPMFAARWGDESDESFRAYAVAVFDLRDAERLSVAEREALFRDLCVHKRREVLSDALGQPVTPRVVNALGRTDWQAFAKSDWTKLFAILLAEKVAADLGHVGRITSVLLGQFALIPEELRTTGLLDVVSGLGVPAERWEQLTRSLQEADGGQRVAFRRMAADIRSNGDFWDFYFRCEGKPSRSFNIPPSGRVGAARAADFAAADGGRISSHAKLPREPREQSLGRKLYLFQAA